MANFSEKELQLIAQQRKFVDEIPKYYSATNRNEVAIGQDFESYLILETQEHKQKTLSWIRDVLKVQSTNVDRDTILGVYLANRVNDAKARVTELDQKLKGFDDFKSGLVTDGQDPVRWTSIVELTLLTQSLQRPLDEISIQRERAFHEGSLVMLMQRKLDTAKTTGDTQKELQSWQTVVSAYKGQTASQSIAAGTAGGLL